MKRQLANLSLFAAAAFILAACGGPSSPPTGAGRVAFSSLSNGQSVAVGSVLQVQGTVLDGASVSLSLDGGAAVPATVTEGQGGRSNWSAELGILASGGHELTATANMADGSTETSTVTFSVDPGEADGIWEGIFENYNATTDERTASGTLYVRYDQGKYLIRWDVNSYIGDTDGWDLLDGDGLRIRATYYPVGSVNSAGHAVPEEQVEYHLTVQDAGNTFVFEGYVSRGSD